MSEVRQLQVSREITKFRGSSEGSAKHARNQNLWCCIQFQNQQNHTACFNPLKYCTTMTALPHYTCGCSMAPFTWGYTSWHSHNRCTNLAVASAAKRGDIWGAKNAAQPHGFIIQHPHASTSPWFTSVCRAVPSYLIANAQKAADMPSKQPIKQSCVWPAEVESRVEVRGLTDPWCLYKKNPSLVNAIT